LPLYLVLQEEQLVLCPNGPLWVDVEAFEEAAAAALVARGLTNRRIALELSISEHTVAKHVAKILKTLKLSSRTELAARITEQGLLSPDPD
jgi:DNA-binding CsgD family transcriptional regulator